MTRELDENLIYKTKRKAREDGLTDDECIALNLFWRKHVKVQILAKVFRVSKNTIYYRALTGKADSYPTSMYSNNARDTNALIDRVGEKKAWDEYVTDDMVRAVEVEMEAELERHEKLQHEPCMMFFVGIHQPSDAKHLGPVFVSVNRLTGATGRRSKFTNQSWIMDSGAFTTIAAHGGYPEPVSAYAEVIRYWASPNLRAAVAQDYMCEPHMLARTGLTITEHQRLTIERYIDLTNCDTGGVTIMPVLQGYAPADYVDHLRQYGEVLPPGAWVGVGSVCKRNGKPGAVLEVLRAIKNVRPDLRLHGFGLKTTSLAVKEIRELLESADSMAWSYAARREQEGNQNNWRYAAALANAMECL